MRRVCWSISKHALVVVHWVCFWLGVDHVAGNGAWMGSSHDIIGGRCRISDNTAILIHCHWTNTLSAWARSGHFCSCVLLNFCLQVLYHSVKGSKIRLVIIFSRPQHFLSKQLTLGGLLRLQYFPLLLSLKLPGKCSLLFSLGLVEKG